MDHSQIKEFVKALRERGRNYKEFGEASAQVSETVKPLKRLIGDPNSKAKDSRLITTGIALIALPDPFIVTDVAGSALVAAGLIKNRMRQPTAADVFGELRKITRNLGNLKKELLIKTRI